MNFWAQYGLFLLKTITLVIAFPLAFIAIVASSRKSKPSLEIISLTEKYQDLQQRMLAEIKPHQKIKITRKMKKQALKRSSVYVLDFNGDIKASQVESLSKAVNAVLAIAQPEDEVVIRLESPGGLVNGYGLGAAQLERIRNKQIPLTVCIDKVAASGGYLMACVANKIIAAPFAIIGSIGVVAQMPNFHRWLKKNNIDVELLTAGEYKRTLTLLGENTEKGRQKFQQELEQIHHSFRNYVLVHRNQLDIDKIATGEHWLAQDAYDLRLVDSLKTSDDYLIEKMSTHNVFKLAIPSKMSLLDKLLKPALAVLQHKRLSYWQ